ncbi:MAG: transglutaminase domain-containing protein [Patescibacteria group bacterium]
MPYITTTETGDVQYAVTIGRCTRRKEEHTLLPMEISGELDSELKKKIDDLKRSKLPPMKLKREIVKLVRDHLTYSNSPDAYQKYVATPVQYFQKIWEHKEADCFVANTLAVRALAEVDSRIRFVSGYFVKDKDKNGNAIMHKGNGHAWLEVWDEMSEHWVRLDATPKGDPNIDEAEQNRELEGETGEGDYGDEEIATNEETKEKIKEIKKKEGGGKGKPKKPTFSLEEERFSELAECSPAEAQKFLHALERVRAITNEHGISISEGMKEEWRKIMKERKVESRNFKGPVRMDQGINLEDPASAHIDIRSGQFNPTGFETEETKEKIKTEFGGLNIYFSFDLSGSMKEPDGASGRSKADVQRDIALLFVDSLMQCSFMTRQQGADSDLLPIKIMVTLASDAGEVKLHLTDRWGPKEQHAFYSALVQIARGGTPTHQTLQLIEKDFQKEKIDLKKKGIPNYKLPLHYAPIITDGAPNDPVETTRMRASLKEQGMVSRSYIVGGEATADDVTIESFSQIPKLLQKDIITLMHTLRPNILTDKYKQLRP